MPNNSPEILGNSEGQSAEFTKPTLTEKLEHFGLNENDYTSEEFQQLGERFESHLALYERPADLNMRLLEERIDGNLTTTEEKKKAFEDWLWKIAVPENKSTNGVADIIEKIPKNDEESIAVMWKMIEESWGLPKWINGLGIGAAIASFAKESPFISWILWKMTGINISDIYDKWWENFKKEEIIDIETPKTETQAQDWEPETPAADADIENPVDAGESVETSLEITEINKRDTLYRAGATFILSLSWERIDRNESSVKDFVLNKIKKLSYQEISTAKNDILWEEQSNPDYVSMLKEVQNWIKAQNTRDLLRIHLSAENVKDVLLPNGEENEKILPYLGDTPEQWKERIISIINSIENGSFRFDTLSFSELSILYVSSMPALSISGISWLGSLWNEVQDLAGEQVKEIEEIIPEGKTSQTLIEAFGREFENLDFWGNTITKEDEELRSRLWGNLIESDKEILEKLIEFKKFILSEAFIWNPNLWMNEDHKKAFIENLNYWWVIALYECMRWEEKILDGQLPFVVLTISHVIWKIWKDAGTNAYLASHYLGGYWRSVLLASENPLELSDDQKRIMEIYSEKIIDTTIFSYIVNLQAKLGLLGSVTWQDLNTLAISAIAAWVWSNLVWNRFIKKWISGWRLSVMWQLLKKAGWASIFLGALLWWVEILGNKFKSGSFTSDLEAAIESENPQNVVEILKQHEESVEEFDVNGEKMTLVSYPGDTPFIGFRGKLWSFSIVDTGWNGLIESLLNTVSEETDQVVWEDWNTHNIHPVTSENWVINFWGTGFSLPIENLWEVSDVQESKNWVQQINEWMNSWNSPWDRNRKLPFLNWTTQEYIPVEQIGTSSSYISLIAVSE